MEKFKWGVIGTGKIAHTFATALKHCERAELCGVASRTSEKAKAFADEFGFENYYGSYADFAENCNAEIVYIATPMASHFADAKLCIENGKNVLCEKSLTLNSTQTEELLALAKEKGVFFMEAMWMKCRPVYRKMKEWIASGLIGSIEYIKADFSNFIPYNENDRLFRADCGGGCLLDLGIYPLTLAHDLLGMPDEINGYEYEVDEVHRCLEEGLLESPLVPHSDTIEVMKLMDECRKQWGMKFPNE